MTIPDGYTDKWDPTTWNYGFVFRWSSVFEAWLEEGVCTVKPGWSLKQAYEAWAEEPYWTDYRIFFTEG